MMHWGRSPSLCKEKEISTAVWQEKGMFLYAPDFVTVIWGQVADLLVLYFVLKEMHEFLLWHIDMCQSYYYDWYELDILMTWCYSYSFFFLLLGERFLPKFYLSIFYYLFISANFRYSCPFLNFFTFRWHFPSSSTN